MNLLKTIGIFPTLLLLCSIGCGGGSSGTVEGTVRIDGEPMGGFFVYFIPADGSAEPLGGVTGDGKYKLVYGRGKNQIPVGEYRVYLEPTGQIDNVPKPKVKLDRQFTSAAEATLVKKIEPGSNVIDLEFPSAKKK